MPLQNRVLPTGDIVAVPARGTFTGNRGIIHREDQTLGTSRWSHHAWICCTLNWQGRRRPVMTGRNWTELFFLDEAVALAAGHRPCGYCRRTDYNRFLAAWEIATGACAKAPEIDKILHPSRVDRFTRKQITFRAQAGQLPNGTFIQIEDKPYLCVKDGILPFMPTRYGAKCLRPTGPTRVLTPAPLVAVLRAGYLPYLHPTADP